MFSIPSASSIFTIIQHISVFLGCFDKKDPRFLKSFCILSSYILLCTDLVFPLLLPSQKTTHMITGKKMNKEVYKLGLCQRNN